MPDTILEGGHPRIISAKFLDTYQWMMGFNGSLVNIFGINIFYWYN
jgi:hypothetical protein